MSPEQKRLRASIAANERWAREPDRHAATQAARDGRWRRYIDKATALAPAGATPEEIARRAHSLRNADMQRMTLAAARKKRAS